MNVNEKFDIQKVVSERNKLLESIDNIIKGVQAAGLSDKTTEVVVKHYQKIKDNFNVSVKDLMNNSASLHAYAGTHLAKNGLFALGMPLRKANADPAEIAMLNTVVIPPRQKLALVA